MTVNNIVATIDGGYDGGGNDDGDDDDGDDNDGDDDDDDDDDDVCLKYCSERPTARHNLLHYDS